MRIPTVSIMSWNNNVVQSKANSKFYSNNPSFNAVDVSKLKKMPLEEKLTHLFTTVSVNDLIVAGKNMKEIQLGLKKAISAFDHVIKRIFFVAHGGLAVPLAFTSNKVENDIQCTNIGENKIIYSNFMETEFLEPNESLFINDGDILINKNVNIPIQVSVDFSKHLTNFEDMEILLNPAVYATEVYDFNEKQQKMINNANVEIIESIDKAKKLEKEKTKYNSSQISFDDVGGLENEIKTLKKGIIYPIEFPYAYKNRKKINHGFMLYGPPGTGKTLLAQAVASEVDASYVKLNGLEMESKWVGESEENWRKLFAEAKKNQPTIIFIDEFDAVARKRTGQDIHGDKVVNQLLTLMTDIEQEGSKVFVIAATNKLDVIDDAISRSGRFGEYVKIAEPDRYGLDRIYEIHARDKNIDSDFDKAKFLDKCYQMKMTGADIAFLLNKAQDVSWERCGIYEKMDNHTLQETDVFLAKINEDDFYNAYEEMVKSRSKQVRNPVGYKR